MKSTFKSFFRRLLGLELPRSRVVVQSIHSEPAGASGAHPGVRLARLPFILAHVLAYAIVFFLLQLSRYLSSGSEAAELSNFTYAVLLFVISVALLPVHIRRAHDLGWSLRYPLYFSVLPAFLRICCLLIPLFALFKPDLITKLFAVMPYIGLLYWVLNQIQLIFMILLTFAPGTGTHNKYGEQSRAFVFENLYGFKIFGRKRIKKSK